MTSRTFPGQRKFPVSLFKGSCGPFRRAVSGIRTHLPAGRQERQSQAGGVGRGVGSCPALGARLSPISFGEHWRGGKLRKDLCS